MIIPKDPTEKLRLYEELVRQCTASRTDRFNFYQTLRSYYLFGSPDTRGAPYNKIGSTVDTLNSFIYSPDTLRFSLHLGTEAPVDDVHKSVPLAQEVTEQWRVSKTHILFGVGLRWACVFGIMMMKVLWSRNGVRSYLVEPHQFGVGYVPAELIRIESAVARGRSEDLLRQPGTVRQGSASAQYPLGLAKLLPVRCLGDLFVQAGPLHQLDRHRQNLNHQEQQEQQPTDKAE